MLYNIYYSEEYMPNDFPLYIQETKEFNTFKEATCYAFQRCFEKQLDLEYRSGSVEDFIDNAKRDPYLKDQGASDELIQAIGRKRYCMETTADLRFYAVPVEDDKIIGHTFKEGILK